MADADEYAVECAICYNYRSEDDAVPECACDGCGKPFHGTCLSEWLRGLPTTQQSFNRLFGGLTSEHERPSLPCSDCSTKIDDSPSPDYCRRVSVLQSSHNSGYVDAPVKRMTALWHTCRVKGSQGLSHDSSLPSLRFVLPLRLYLWLSRFGFAVCAHASTDHK